MEKIRDRIKDLRRVKASELIRNPKNWRTHPLAQREALEGVLAQIGYADALIARENPKGDLELIDGHLRAETTPDTEVPVLVLDLTEREADLMLATLDPLGAMAGRDDMKLRDLLDGVESHSAGISELLDSLIGKSPNFEDTDSWEEEWKGMPEFEQEDLMPYRTVKVHFRNDEDVQIFASLMGQSITDSTKSIWHPILEKNTYQDSQYVDSKEV